jgi:hypothetical protein
MRRMVALIPSVTIKTSAVLVAALALTAAGCGEKDEATTPTTASTKAKERPEQQRESIPASLRTLESSSEDLIDDALAGKRPGVVAKAKALRETADGAAADDLREAKVPAKAIKELQTRARAVEKLAPKANFVNVALASNRVFGMVPDFFARYRTKVPPGITRLDHSDFEAKLRARAGDRKVLKPVVARLDKFWKELRPRVVNAGGSKPAKSYSAHVKRMKTLAKGTDMKAAEREAQHGLDLVDQLEQVYER